MFIYLCTICEFKATITDILTINMYAIRMSNVKGIAGGDES